MVKVLKGRLATTNIMLVVAMVFVCTCALVLLFGCGTQEPLTSSTNATGSSTVQDTKASEGTSDSSTSGATSTGAGTGSTASTGTGTGSTGTGTGSTASTGTGTASTGSTADTSSSNTGSSAASTGTSIVGTYVIVSMDLNGDMYTGDDLETALADSGGSSKNYIKIIDSQSLTMNLNGLVAPMTYTLSGGVLVARDVTDDVTELKLQGDTITVTFTDQLVAQGNGYTAVFQKQ